jgi:hypothetical protein
VREQTRSCGAASHAASTGGPGCWAGGRDGSKAPVEQTDHALHRWPSLPLLNAETSRARRGISALPSSPHIIEPGCPSRHPRSLTRLAAHQLRAHRCCCLTPKPTASSRTAKPIRDRKPHKARSSRGCAAEPGIHKRRQGRMGRGSRRGFAKPVVVLDPRLRGDDSVEAQAPSSSNDPGSSLTLCLG